MKKINCLVFALDHGDQSTPVTRELARLLRDMAIDVTHQLIPAPGGDMPIDEIEKLAFPERFPSEGTSWAAILLPITCHHALQNRELLRRVLKTKHITCIDLSVSSVHDARLILRAMAQPAQSTHKPVNRFLRLKRRDKESDAVSFYW